MLLFLNNINIFLRKLTIVFQIIIYEPNSYSFINADKITIY